MDSYRPFEKNNETGPSKRKTKQNTPPPRSITKRKGQGQVI
jgi:hypothetical protein